MAKSKTPGQVSPHERGDLVLTPGGWRPKSKVIYVPPDHHVSGEGGKLKVVHTATGRVVRDLGAIPRVSRARSAGRTAPRGAARMLRVPPAARPKGAPPPAPITNGWIVNAEWTNTTGNPISYFSTKWIVPPAPATDNSQLIYLFNGIQQTSSGPFILQPVLQWGSSPAGGGSYWSITNWYVDGQGGTALHGNLVQVNSGDLVTGIMTLTGQSGAQFSYLSSFDGVSTADLNVSNIDELKWANQTLECYGFKAFTDYPDTALTAFYDIEIKVRTQTTPSIIDTEAMLNWLDDNNVTDNGQQAVTVSNDSPRGDVYLYYRTVTQSLYFVTDKSTFGRDEVTDVIANNGGRFTKAFWVVLEGFTIDQLSIDHPSPLTPVLSGAFKNINGVTIAPSAGGPEYELPGDTYTPQRISFPFDIVFTNAALATFPNPGDAPLQKALQGAMNVSGSAFAATANFELIGGADPYFTNVDPTQDNAFYLSQDLRVFTAAPAINNHPVAGGPAFGADSVAGAYEYVQNLLTHLNATYSNPGGTDPFTSVLPGQGAALSADSSVTPYSIKSFFPPLIAINYNFAIARVRLRGSSGPAGEAQNVRVFFRMWQAQSPDTDYQQGSTYLSNPDAAGLPGSPLPAPDSSTIPFFATSNAPNLGDPGNPEYGTGGVNNRTIEISSGDAVWAYFGCFLNVYDPSFTVNGQIVQAVLAGTHHCIVAQIAYDDAPIVNANGVVMSPENSDKLAQRNLQVTHSDNPGIAATHRVPQAFDIRPSAALATTPGALLEYPDELMIEWGPTPPGSVASIYWPQVNTKDVLSLASKLYGAHQLTAPDSTTVQCKAIKGVTYVPIPPGSGQNFASLFTIDLPQTVVVGQEFNVVVRRITTKRFQDIVVREQPREPAASNIKFQRNWRYVVGTFQVRIPVSTKEVMLLPEENTLAIMKWRLQVMAPSNRWYPVLQRYISYIAGRVDGLGGDSTSIQPSPTGVPIAGVGGKDAHERSGKVCEVLFDCFGDFEGFVLCSCSDTYVLRSRERAIGEIVLRACRDRLTVSVVEAGGKIKRIGVKC